MEHKQQVRAAKEDIAISRREFLKGAAIVGGASVLSVVVAACSPAPTTAPAGNTPAAGAVTPTAAAAAATPAAATPKSGGILIWGVEVAFGNLVPLGNISQGQ